MVGIVLDYLDDRNFMLFAIDDKQAYFLQYRDGDLVGAAKTYWKSRKRKILDLIFPLKALIRNWSFL